MTAIQLEFFKDVTPETIKEDRLARVEVQLGNVRRGAFSRMSDLAIGLVELTYEIDRLHARLDKIEKRRDIDIST